MIHLRAFVALVAVSTAFITASVAAQERTQPVPGERVRVVTSEGLEHDGLLERLGSEAIELQVGRSALLTVPTSSIEELWVYRGVRRAAGRGARVGLLVGVTGGAVVGTILGGCGGDCSRIPSAGTGAILFGGLGAMSGLIIGTFIKSGPWHESSWSPEVDVSSITG